MIDANAELNSEDYAAADQKLAAVNAVLDGIDQNAADPFAEVPQARDYLAVVQAVQTSDYQAQQITVQGDQAQVWATSTKDTAQSGAKLVKLQVLRIEGKWIVEVTGYKRKGIGVVLPYPLFLLNAPEIYGQVTNIWKIVLKGAWQ